MEEALNNIIKVYVAQTHSAVKISEIICEHSDRDVMTGHDIICGLVYRLMVPMTEEEISEAMEKAEHILNGSDEESDTEDGINEDYEIVQEDTDKDGLKGGGSRKIQSNHCNCDVFHNIHRFRLSSHKMNPARILHQLCQLQLSYL
mgnify:CR=1 FL=1